ncbi:PorP/SprF family type IX secretion system membrane protein [Ferruginibacter yonginensis]|uniref:PorP/SprF family type IX secretion system membrane protein n=1 Tax=Ferruginibacter yonginensis TaxID=1310416 RepID=A0ABV8QUH7_9BACT
MKNIYILLAIIFCLSSFSTAAQDLNFSQFYEMPLLRNPALAGIYKGDLRISAAYRNQWQSVTTPYTSQALGLETKFAVNENSDNYIALGLQFTNDVAGDAKLGKTQILPTLTFHKSLAEESDTYLSLGFMGGPVQQRFDVSKLQFDDQFVNGAYSASNGTQQVLTNTNVTYIDAGVGVLFSSTVGDGIKYYVGASLFHFNKPKVAFDKTNNIILNKKLMVNGGLSIPTSDYDKLIVYGDYFTQGGSNQMQGGLMYQHDLVQQDEDEAISLAAGAMLRWNDAVIPVVKLNYYNVGVGMTYDVNISKLKTASQLRGGFELTLTYTNFLNIRNSSVAKTRCPAAL